MGEIRISETSGDSTDNYTVVLGSNGYAASVESAHTYYDAIDYVMSYDEEGVCRKSSGIPIMKSVSTVALM